jgi:hypothetical protein
LGKVYEFETKDMNYYSLGTMMGSVHARGDIGTIEEAAGNDQRAFKHYLIAAKSADKLCLDKVTEGYKDGLVTKDEYTYAFRTYQKSLDDTKISGRGQAAAYHITVRLRMPFLERDGLQNVNQMVLHE